MRILLKNTVTEKFLGERGKWIENPDAARSFPDEGQAKDYFTFRRLPNIVVLLLPEAVGATAAPAPVVKPVAAAEPVSPKAAAAEPVSPKAAAVASAGETVVPAILPASPASPAEPEAEPVISKAETQRAPARTTRASVPRVEATKTTIQANVDVGMGNSVFIRGQGEALSWERGMPLDCVNGNTWIWSTTQAHEKVVFKLLLNDQTWAQGGDLVVEAGKKLEIAPTF